MDSTIEKNIKKNEDELSSQNEGDYNHWNASLKDSQIKWEGRLRKIREDLELRLKIEIHEIEERLNSHINALLRQHEDDFNDIKE